MLTAILDKTPVTGPSVIYDVYSGNLIAGRIIQHNTGGHDSGTWSYSFSFANMWPQGTRAPGEGGFDTMDLAMSAMRSEFEKWLEWAGLREVD